MSLDLSTAHTCHRHNYKLNFCFIIAILLMGEPVNWEKSLQIIIDILLTRGIPNEPHRQAPDSTIPVVAVNTDYLWMSGACSPRLLLLTVFVCVVYFIGYIC